MCIVFQCLVHTPPHLVPKLSHLTGEKPWDWIVYLRVKCSTLVGSFGSAWFNKAHSSNTLDSALRMLFQVMVIAIHQLWDGGYYFHPEAPLSVCELTAVVARVTICNLGLSKRMQTFINSSHIPFGVSTRIGRRGLPAASENFTACRPCVFLFFLRWPAMMDR